MTDATNTQSTNTNTGGAQDTPQQNTGTSTIMGGDGQQTQGQQGSSSTAPEKYDFKLGDDSVLDAKYLEEASTYAKAMGFSQEVASKMVERENGLVGSAVQAYMQQAQEQWDQQVKAWPEAIRNDKELGGGNFDANLSKVQRVMARFGSPALRETLNQTGLGNHPELFRLLVKIGSAISEEGMLITGANTSPSKPRNPEEILYPSMTGKAN